MSLPETNITQIWENVFDQILLDGLKEDDGLDTLVAFPDGHLKMDDLDDEFQRKSDMSIAEYIASLDSRYRKIEKLKMALPSEILAFKLQKKANISKEEKMLVLTGMNYMNKKTLFEAAKSSRGLLLRVKMVLAQILNWNQHL